MRQSAAMHSAEQHGSRHCSAPTHANRTGWMRLSVALPVLLVPSWITHSHICTCIQTRTHTHNYYDHLLAVWPDYQCSTKPTLFWSNSRKPLPHPDLFFHPANQTFSLLCRESCKWSNYWQQIGNLQPGRKVAEAQRKPANWDWPPMATRLFKMPFTELVCRPCQDQPEWLSFSIQMVACLLLNTGDQISKQIL